MLLTSNQSWRFDWRLRLKADLSFKIRIWLGHCEYWTCLIDSSLDLDLVSPDLTWRLLVLTDFTLDLDLCWLIRHLTWTFLDWLYTWLRTFLDWLIMWLELILTDLVFQFGLYWLVTWLGPIWIGFSLNLDLSGLTFYLTRTWPSHHLTQTYLNWLYTWLASLTSLYWLMWLGLVYSQLSLDLDRSQLTWQLIWSSPLLEI